MKKTVQDLKLLKESEKKTQPEGPMEMKILGN